MAVFLEIHATHVAKNNFSNPSQVTPEDYLSEACMLLASTRARSRRWWAMMEVAIHGGALMRTRWIRQHTCCFSSWIGKGDDGWFLRFFTWKILCSKFSASQSCWIYLTEHEHCHTSQKNNYYTNRSMYYSCLCFKIFWSKHLLFSPFQGKEKDN